MLEAKDKEEVQVEEPKKEEEEVKVPSYEDKFRELLLDNL